MTETRAPFNGKKKDPIGVFVRLHDGMLNEKQIAALCNPKRSSTENILTIGTPVTGGEMDYYAQIIWFEDAPEPEIVAWRNRDIKKGDNIKVVRQTDALAKLAEKDAEIARLRKALEGAKIFHEEQGKAISKQPPSAQGQWRRHQHQEQIENIEEALKGPEA